MTSRPRKQRRRGPLIIWKGPGGCRMGNMLKMIFDVDGTSKMIYTTKQQRFWLKAILLPCFFFRAKDVQNDFLALVLCTWSSQEGPSGQFSAASCTTKLKSASTRENRLRCCVFCMWNFPLWSLFFLLSYRTSLVRPYRHQTIESNWHQVTQFTSAI